MNACCEFCKMLIKKSPRKARFELIKQRGVEGPLSQVSDVKLIRWLHYKNSVRPGRTTSTPAMHDWLAAECFFKKSCASFHHRPFWTKATKYSNQHLLNTLTRYIKFLNPYKTAHIQACNPVTLKLDVLTFWTLHWINWMWRVNLGALEVLVGGLSFCILQNHAIVLSYKSNMPGYKLSAHV